MARLDPLLRRELKPPEVDRGDEDAVAAEPGVEMAQVQQAAGEQDARRRPGRGRARLARRRAPAESGAVGADDPAPRDLQRRRRAVARGAQSRREAEERAGDDAKRGSEGERAPVGAEREHDRVVRRGDEGHQRVAHQRRQEHPARNPHRREQRAFREQLPHDAHTRRAEAETHANLALAGAGPREQQVREVRARDQQHDAGGGEQHPQRMPRTPRAALESPASPGIASSLKPLYLATLAAG